MGHHPRWVVPPAPDALNPRAMSPFSQCSKLTSLTPDQKEQLASWLLDENVTYRQAAARVKEVFGFSVTPNTIMNFWHRECVPRKLLRSAEAAKSVQTLAATSQKMDWQDTNAQLLGQRVFETLAAPEVDMKVVVALGAVLEKIKTRTLHEKTLKARLATEKRREAQRERQLAFARERFEFDAADAALAHAPAIRTITADGALSSDEKREQVRRLLFPQAFASLPVAEI